MTTFIPPKLTVCKNKPAFHGKRIKKIQANDENNSGSRLAPVLGNDGMLQRLVQ